MNRYTSMACAALVGAAGAGASAQVEPTIYGILDIGAGRFQDPGSPRRLIAQSGAMTSSFLGIRGSDDLGGGLRARFGLETYVGVDTGTAGRFAGDAFYSRTAYVGLQGAFGTSLLGRLPTPLWTATLLFNPFGESAAFSPSIRQYFGGAVLGDSRWNNSVGFTSAEPEGGNGARYSVQFNPSEGQPGATGRNVSAGVVYTSGPLAATGVWQRVRNGIAVVPAGFSHQNTFQVGASYEFRVVRLYGQAGTVKTSATTGVKTTLYQLGAVVPVGLGFVIGSFGHARTETAGADSIRRTLSLGYDYYLSKNTDLYAVLMNEHVTRLSTATTAAAGMRLRF